MTSPHRIRRKSLASLIQLACLFSFILIGVLLEKDFLIPFLFGPQSTPLGVLINGFILGLLVLSFVANLGWLLVNFMEEKALRQFMLNRDHPEGDPLARVSEKSLIAKRYRDLMELEKRGSPIDQGALAHLLASRLSLRHLFSEYVASILILLGMLGTILALGMALMGSSSLINSLENIKGMGAVIANMSTALSTTITAIVCYMAAKFSLHLVIASDRELAYAIEAITTHEILPDLSQRVDTLVPKLQSLLERLDQLTEGLTLSQKHLRDTQGQLSEGVLSLGEHLQGVTKGIATINANLEKGFRL